MMRKDGPGFPSIYTRMRRADSAARTLSRCVRVALGFASVSAVPDISLTVNRALSAVRGPRSVSGTK